MVAMTVKGPQWDYIRNITLYGNMHTYIHICTYLSYYHYYYHYYISDVCYYYSYCCSSYGSVMGHIASLAAR